MRGALWFAVSAMVAIACGARTPLELASHESGGASDEGGADAGFDVPCLGMPDGVNPSLTRVTGGSVEGAHVRGIFCPGLTWAAVQTGYSSSTGAPIYSFSIQSAAIGSPFALQGAAGATNGQITAYVSLPSNAPATFDSSSSSDWYVWFYYAEPGLPNACLEAGPACDDGCTSLCENTSCPCVTAASYTGQSAGSSTGDITPAWGSFRLSLTSVVPDSTTSDLCFDVHGTFTATLYRVRSILFPPGPLGTGPADTLTLSATF
jgi:hypothetical protein